jgi:peptide/nickel transport system permease protein
MRWRGEVMSQRKLIYLKFRRNRLAVLGAILLVFFVFCAVFADYLAPYDPLQADLMNNLAPPSSQHILGTDELGRDLLSRIIHGARISLHLGVISVGTALVFGVLVGAVAGYYGGVIDQIVMRAVDIVLSFPTMLLAIMIVAVLGPGLTNAMIAVGISLTPEYARLTRSTFLYLRELDYVQAARMVGASDPRVIFRHILPNSLAPLIVQSTLNIATAILSAAALGFLGLGAQPPLPEWGAMLSKGRVYLMVAPHVTLYPGLAIVLSVLSLNMIGDGLRDALDPRMT